MSQTIVFVHGAWMTPLCWEKFTGFFEAKGYQCLAPAWPYKDKTVEELRKNPPAGLATLGITDIVDHYQGIIEKLDGPAILIGHSYGGLFVQMLLDRGLGMAGVAIDPAPPKGVLPFYWSTVRSNLPILSRPGGWRKIVYQSLKTFQYAFVHMLPQDEQRAVYERYVVPESGRVFFQTAFSLFNNTSYVNFRNDRRAPLLLIAGSEDKVVPARLNRVNFKRYKDSRAVTNFKEFEGRCHWIIAQDGWEEVADYIATWLDQLPKNDASG